jgi:hypothetical protein
MVKELFKLIPRELYAVHEILWAFFQKLKAFFQSGDILGRYSSDIFTIIQDFDCALRILSE